MYVKTQGYGGVIIKTVMNCLKRFEYHQFMLLITILALFLPFYICFIIWLLQCLYLLYTKEMIQAYQHRTGSKYVLLFSLISMLVSLFYRNYIGAGCTIIVLCVLSIVIYYMEHITLSLFEWLVDIILVMSIFSAVYGLFEYAGILHSIGVNQFEVLVLDGPYERLNSVFFNANYYATMIEFFVILSVYKLLRCKKNVKVFFYLGVILINFFLLYLSGCRTAWPAIGFGILVLLLFDQRYGAFKLMMALGCVCLIVFLIYPEVFPRTDNILEYFGVRQGIWEVAIKCIKDHLFFGEGPLTYMHIFEQYGGVYTQHAHSIYLDPILSYGLVGVASIFPYVYASLKSLIKMYLQKNDLSLSALMIGTLAIVLVHGIMDYTVYFVQTGFLFLMIMSSYAVYEHRK